MKKRKLIAAISIAVILLLVISLIVMNYVKYSSCRDADSAEDKPGCYLFTEQENKTLSLLPFKIRVSMGKIYFGSE